MALQGKIAKHRTILEIKVNGMDFWRDERQLRIFQHFQRKILLVKWNEIDEMEWNEMKWSGVITQVFLEVVEKENIPEVTTNQPSDKESSQSVSREGSLYKI